MKHMLAHRYPLGLVTHPKIIEAYGASPNLPVLLNVSGSDPHHDYLIDLLGVEPSLPFDQPLIRVHPGVPLHLKGVKVDCPSVISRESFQVDLLNRIIQANSDLMRVVTGKETL